MIGSLAGSGEHLQSRGFGFVTFKHKESATAAVNEHYVALFGKKVGAQAGRTGRWLACWRVGELGGVVLMDGRGRIADGQG